MIKRYKIRRKWYSPIPGRSCVTEDENGAWMRAADVLPELERLRRKVDAWEDIEFAPGRVVGG